jgi:hypothetical protein
VQRPVAQLLRLSEGERTVEEPMAGPGEQVGGGHGEFEPGSVDCELPGWEPSEAGGFARADAVFDAGVGPVTDLEELDRQATVPRRVGGEDLVAHPVDGVEQ